MFLQVDLCWNKAMSVLILGLLNFWSKNISQSILGEKLGVVKRTPKSTQDQITNNLKITVYK